MSLENKVIVVTGGNGLLGKSFVKAINKAGGIPVIADINEKSEMDYAYVKLDITSKKSIIKAIKHIDKKYGHIDGLINNAYPRNKNYGQLFENVDYEDFCDNLNMNLGGYFLTSQQFITYFQKQGYGNVINISSIYGVITPRFEIYNNTEMTTPIEYIAIKSALINLTKYMAKYFKGSNIRFNSVSLGGIFNNQPDSFIQGYNSYCLNKGMLDPKDINGVIIFLLSENSTFINGQNIIVDDGFTL